MSELGLKNRQVDPDSEYILGEQSYPRFLLEEIIPDLRNEYRVTDNPDQWAIAGHSSGGICARTAAWERPDAFRRVLSMRGSFVDIRGGHNYPSLIRKTPPKPIRVFLQSGVNDFDLVCGNWPPANQQMAAALKFAGYDYQFAFGNGCHSLAHRASMLPNILRWLWR